MTLNLIHYDFYCRISFDVFAEQRHFCLYIHHTGKVLIIGGGIANFTNVAATFKVILAFVVFSTQLQECPQTVRPGETRRADNANSAKLLFYARYCLKWHSVSLSTLPLEIK